VLGLEGSTEAPSTYNRKQYVYVWADGVYFDTCLEDGRADIVVSMGATVDGKKELIAVAIGYRESKPSGRRSCGTPNGVPCRGRVASRLRHRRAHRRPRRQAAVVHSDWFDPELTPKVQSLALQYGAVILPTKTYAPRHKGKVEAGAKYVKNNGLKGHRFASL